MRYWNNTSEVREIYIRIKFPNTMRNKDIIGHGVYLEPSADVIVGLPQNLDILRYYR